MELTRELVIARFSEDVNWLLQVSPSWKITLYNKGADDIPADVAQASHIKIVPLENKGREAETYAYHMMTRYDDIADLTLYLQGNPFEHAPEILECISILEKKEISNDECFIPLTIRYTNSLPPPYITASRQNRFYRVDPVSSYTFDCIKFPDRPVTIVNKWLKINKMKIGANIVHTALHQIAGGSIFEKTDTIVAHFAACFSVTRTCHLQHSKEFYNGLHTYSYKDVTSPYILEKLWLHIFNQTFDASKVLPEYSIPADTTLFAAVDTDIGSNIVPTEESTLSTKLEAACVNGIKTFGKIIEQDNAIHEVNMKVSQLLQQLAQKKPTLKKKKK